MRQLREEPLIVQDEYLSLNPFIEPEEDDDLDYSNDDLGENSEITPLGDDIEDDDIEDIKLFETPGEDEDDLLDDDDDLLLDDEDNFVEDDDEIVDISPIDDEDDGDDELLDDDEDDDLFEDDDDDEILNPDVIPVIPDTDDDDDDEGTWADDEVEDEDNLLRDEDEASGSTTAGLDPNFQSRHPERKTGRMIDHEPGVPGFTNE